MQNTNRNPLVAPDEQNPFLTDLALTIAPKRETTAVVDLAMHNKTTGEILPDVATFTTTKLVDAATFVKIFANGIAAISNLNAAGTKVLRYLLTTLEGNPTDLAILDRTSLNRMPDPISQNTFYAGLKSLQAVDIIRTTKTGPRNAFWVNPDMVFAGNRIRLVAEYHRHQTAPKQTAASAATARLLAQNTPPKRLNTKPVDASQTDVEDYTK